MLLQVPPPTQFDLRFSIFGIPVRVHPLFWVIGLLLGSGSNGLTGAIIWVVVIFISILVHELGHAFAFRRFGQDSHVILHFAGGLTVPESVPWGGGYANVRLTSNEQVFVSLAGPGAGFLLAAATLSTGFFMGGSIVTSYLLGFIPIPLVLFQNDILNQIFISFLWVNIFWGFVNLIPVYPLDGGHVARHILIQRDPLAGLRTSLWISVISGGLAAIIGLLFLDSVYMGVLFGFLAFQSFQALQGTSGGY